MRARDPRSALLRRCFEREGDGFAASERQPAFPRVVGWHDAAVGDAHADWARAAIAASAGASRRLVALKSAYDPTNVFRRNQNIEPDAV